MLANEKNNAAYPSHLLQGPAGRAALTSWQRELTCK